MSYRVYVGDNYHYMDESETYTLGPFESRDEAVALSRGIVDDFLVANHRPGMSAAELLELYHLFGEDPSVVPTPGEGAVPFSAWDYAAQRVTEICGNGPIESSGG